MNSIEVLQRQYYELKHIPLSDLGYNIELGEGHNLYNWRISLLGAKDTSYAGGIFLINLIFPEDYPNTGPRIIFLTPIYHPNVSSYNGIVGVNFIYNWNKSTTAREILTKLYGIFYLTNPHSPYSTEQANEFRYNRYLYELKVKYFTKKYANINSYEDIKNSGKWNFSFSLDDLKILKPPEPLEITIYNNNETITLNFEVNGNCKKLCMTFSSDIITNDAVKKFILNYNIEERNILFIYDRRKLNMDKTLGNNGLKDNSLITVITGVQF